MCPMPRVCGSELNVSCVHPWVELAHLGRVILWAGFGEMSISEASFVSRVCDL